MHLTLGFRPERSVDSVALPAAIASVKRLAKLTRLDGAHNLGSGKYSDQVVELLATADQEVLPMEAFLLSELVFRGEFDPVD